jgi:hypothetical protein
VNREQEFLNVVVSAACGGGFRDNMFGSACHGPGAERITITAYFIRRISDRRFCNSEPAVLRCSYHERGKTLLLL